MNQNFRLTVYFTVVYLCGCILLLLPAVMVESEEFEDVVVDFITDDETITGLRYANRILTASGLVLIMIAAGVLRPSLLSFAEEQFTFLHFSKKYAKFLVYCYVIVNIASLISATTIPYLRDLKSCSDCKLGIYATYVALIFLALLLIVLAIRCFKEGGIKRTRLLWNMLKCTWVRKMSAFTSSK